MIATAPMTQASVAERPIALRLWKGVSMSTYRPRTAHSDAIKRPDCPKCGTRMNLFGIEPEKAGHELLTFVCPKCEHIETAIGKSA